MSSDIPSLYGFADEAIVLNENSVAEISLEEIKVYDIATGQQIPLSQLLRKRVKYPVEVVGKAGRSRHRGIRPQTRGSAMNPIDHPHGGGEGRSSGGRHPVTPWGVPTKGKKTRKVKPSDRYILKRRK